MKSGPFTDTHDELHDPDGADPEWAETCWFSFDIPERELSCHLYAFFKPTLGVLASSVHLWDTSGDQTWNCRYSRAYWHLPLPDEPLSSMTLPTGLRLQTLEPGWRYAVSYTDTDDVRIDLIFDGFTQPHLLADSHLDQPGRVTGELVLDGDVVALNTFGFRDRSWGSRPQSGPGINGTAMQRGGYSYATASERDAFHALSMDFGDGTESVLHGYLIADGRWGRLVSGTRDVVERDPATGAPTRIRLQATDEHTRSFEATGVAMNRLGFYANANLWSWSCLTQWTWADITSFGEDHDNWSVTGMRRFIRDAGNEHASLRAGTTKFDSQIRRGGYRMAAEKSGLGL